MERWNISITDALKDKLKAEAAERDTKPSHLIIDYIEEHYERVSVPDCEERISSLKRQHDDEMSYTNQDYERQLKKLQDDLTLCKDAGFELEQNQIGEIEQLRIAYEAKCDERCAEYQTRITEREASITELEKASRTAETNNLDLMAKLRAQGENHEKALAEQEHRHKDVLEEEERRHKDITNAMRHEQELTQNNLKKGEEHVVELKGQIQDLKHDKEQLQKQLELVTLRLPAPKEGFWSRVFGRKKKEQDAGG